MTESTPPDRPPKRAKSTTRDSLVLVHTGDGKGKSSSAFGVVVRSVARNWDVAVVQFLKSGEWNTGEQQICSEKLGVDWWSLGEGFTWDSNDLSEDEAVAQAAWAHAQDCLNNGRYRLVVLDEITYPLNWGWLLLDDVVTAVQTRSPKTNVVITGRDAPGALIDIADTATEMRNIKHAYEQGVLAKKGIDY